MDISLWAFLAIATPFTMIMIIVSVVTEHLAKMKKLEIESIKARNANVQNEVVDTVKRELGDLVGRIEVLEAIVTDKKYDLSEKITRLK